MSTTIADVERMLTDIYKSLHRIELLLIQLKRMHIEGESSDD